MLFLQMNRFAFWTLDRILWSPAGYAIPDAMALLTSHSATVLALAALACAALGLAIFQRTKQNTEIAVLELMIAALAVYFTVSAVADALPVSGADAHRTGYILRMVAQMLRVAFFMFGGHFLALTHRRTVLGTDPDDAGQKNFGRIVLVLSYVFGLSAITWFGRVLWLQLRIYEGWAIAAPALPDSFGWGFFSGFTASLWLGIQFQILVNLYTRVPDEKRQRSMMSRWYLTALVRRR